MSVVKLTVSWQQHLKSSGKRCWSTKVRALVAMAKRAKTQQEEDHLLMRASRIVSLEAARIRGQRK